MAIQDDFTVDFVDRKITYSTAFVDDRPPNIYTMNELYSFLQDLFDEPDQMDDPIPMSAQTPTQYTILYPWFIDDNSVKALYGGSLQTSGWTKSGSDGITALRWTSATSTPTSADVGTVITGGTSTATGVILFVDEVNDVVYVRNTSAAQFQDGEVVDGPGNDPDFTVESTNGFDSGENVYANLYSVGSLQEGTEIYVGQEDDFLGGAAYHTANTEDRHIEKIDEWWDSDVDFATGSPNLLGGAGHFDILVKVREMGHWIDNENIGGSGGRLAIFARQFSTVYSHFELVGGVGNFVVPFASTGADLNSQEGPYEVNFDNRSGTDLAVGDILENDTGTNPVGRLRAVVTSVTGGASATGSIEYYLIGENQPLLSTNRTLDQFADNDNVAVRGTSTCTFDIQGAPSKVTNGPAETQSITVTFGDFQSDVDEDSTDEEYACQIDCNNVALLDVYQRLMFLCARGNQDGTVADTQDTLLDSAAGADTEPSEFYRAVGDIVFDYDGGTGTQPTEGEYVVNNGGTASGIVVSVTSGTTGVCVLTQVKGTWADNDQVANPGEHGTNRIVVQGTPRSIVDNTAAPFGTFAGGRFFFAQGVLPINVPAADANNWQTVSLAGETKSPPTQRAITFAGLAVNDRAAIFEVDTAGGDDITKDHRTIGSDAAVSDGTLTLNSTPDNDVPAAGWLRVVDSSATDGTEYRYEYSSWTGTTVTLRSGAGLTGTTTSGGTSTVLNDTGAFTNFGTDGNVKTGHMIRNTSSGGWAVVLRKIDNDSIETTPLSTGTWTTATGWEANQVVVALEDATPGPADEVYFPFIDDVVVSGTSLSTTIKYVGVTELIARARFSDPDVGGTRILPFEQKSIQLTDADLTVTAIRTADPIAS